MEIFVYRLILSANEVWNRYPQQGEKSRLERLGHVNFQQAISTCQQLTALYCMHECGRDVWREAVVSSRGTG